MSKLPDMCVKYMILNTKYGDDKWQYLCDNINDIIRSHYNMFNENDVGLDIYKECIDTPAKLLLYMKQDRYKEFCEYMLGKRVIE